MLTTRELTILKGTEFPQLAEGYLAAKTIAGKRSYLQNVVASKPLPTSPWREPRFTSQIEWFASPTDICNGFIALQKLSRSGKGNEAIGQAMSLEGTTGLGLDRKQWPEGWFKGGSEPGVISRSYYASNSQGQKFVVSFMINDLAVAINDSTRASELLTLAAGAFQLAETK
jgi:hypothetical protein